MASTTTLTTKLVAVSDLIRLPKQYGTALVLCPTLWALFVASGGRPKAHHLLVFTAGSFLMRSAGCVINDVADRHFDRHVERTRTRPLAEGRLSVGEALFIFAALSITAFMLVLTLNRLTIGLSFVGIGLASVYPFVKRVSFFPQAFLGMAFGWGAIMAWSAVRGSIGGVALLVFVANVFWSMAYDTIYALMDMEDDLKVGVKSTAIFFGKRVHGALVVMYTAMTVTLWTAGLVAGLGPFYHAGVAASYVFCLVIVYRVWANPTRETAFRGFVANVWAGVLILFAIIIDMNSNMIL